MVPRQHRPIAQGEVQAKGLAADLHWYLFELAASELLYPPGEPTLPVRIISLFNDFKLGPGIAHFNRL